MTPEELIKAYQDAANAYLMTELGSIAEKAAIYAYMKAARDYEKLTGKDLPTELVTLIGPKNMNVAKKYD